MDVSFQSRIGSLHDDWPRLVAETVRDQLGAEILYVVPVEHVPGRVY